MTTSLRCITIRQPWAELIATGTKRVENRTRRTSCRGLIGIHAGLTLSRDALNDPRVKAQPLPATEHLTRGAIIAVANLGDCHQVTADPGAFRFGHESQPPHQIDSWCCQPWGDYEADDDGRLAWHLVLNGVRRIEPVPAKGSLSLPWFAPPEVAAAVWGQLPDLVPQ